MARSLEGSKIDVQIVHLQPYSGIERENGVKIRPVAKNIQKENIMATTSLFQWTSHARHTKVVMLLAY